MRLSYWDLISLTPYKIDKVGSVKSVTLREIDNLPQKYATYQLYVHLFMITKDEFFTISKIENTEKENFESIFAEHGLSITIFDLLIMFQNSLGSLLLALNFFFDEEVVFDQAKRVFITYKETKKNDNGDEEIIPTGYINRENFDEVCSIILQRCAINVKSKKDDEEQSFKNEKAKRLWDKIHAPKAKTAKDKQIEANFDLANIVSSLAYKQSGLNMLNIWDMTVYNVYDQFARERNGAVYDITKRSVSTWGDKEKRFDIESWFTNNVFNLSNES